MCYVKLYDPRSYMCKPTPVVVRYCRVSVFHGCIHEHSRFIGRFDRNLRCHEVSAEHLLQDYGLHDLELPVTLIHFLQTQRSH
jgi:hypothetical protein